MVFRGRNMGQGVLHSVTKSYRKWRGRHYVTRRKRELDQGYCAKAGVFYTVIYGTKFAIQLPCTI